MGQIRRGEPVGPAGVSPAESLKPNDQYQPFCSVTTRSRWIGWKARPLLRIRYGSEDDDKRSPKAQTLAAKPSYCHHVRRTRSTFVDFSTANVIAWPSCMILAETRPNHNSRNTRGAHKAIRLDWLAKTYYRSRSYTSTRPTPVVLFTPRTIAV
jgi:hypothetical protein